MIDYLNEIETRLERLNLQWSCTYEKTFSVSAVPGFFSVGMTSEARRVLPCVNEIVLTNSNNSARVLIKKDDRFASNS